MSGLGPPLRFKAVNTENGSVLDPEFLTEMMFHHFDHMSFWWEPGKYLDHPLDDEKIILCQSTGLHDARGAEIFCGDVLMGGHQDVFFVAEFEAGCFVFNFDDTVNGVLGKRLSDANGNLTVIGNRWQSREVLEQKAEEVMGRE